MHLILMSCSTVTLISRSDAGIAIVSLSIVTDYLSRVFTGRWTGRTFADATVGAVCIVTITSSQVFTTTRRHRTHLCLFSRRTRPCASVFMCAALRYATLLYLRFAPCSSSSSIGNVETGRAVLFYTTRRARLRSALLG